MLLPPADCCLLSPHLLRMHWMKQHMSSGNRKLICVCICVNSFLFFFSPNIGLNPKLLLIGGCGRTINIFRYSLYCLKGKEEMANSTKMFFETYGTRSTGTSEFRFRFMWLVWNISVAKSKVASLVKTVCLCWPLVIVSCSESIRLAFSTDLNIFSWLFVFLMLLHLYNLLINKLLNLIHWLFFIHKFFE